MKVAVVVANVAARYGGPARAALAYAEGLNSAGCDVRVVTTDQDGDRRLRVPLETAVYQPGGFEIWYYPAGPRVTHRPFSRAFARGIDQAAAWADVLHVSSLYLPHNLFVYIACRRQTTPYVIRPHGTLEPYQRFSSARLKSAFDRLFGRRYIAGAAGYHFTANSEASAAADLVDPARSFVVPVPISMPSHVSHVIEHQTVLFLGRITAKKRLDLLVAAWPSIQERFPKASLLIAGPVDPDQAHLVEKARSLNGVEVLGTVDGQSKSDLWAKSGIFVLPSENENFGVAVAEAMSHGIPVVITPNVALASTVDAHNAGKIVATGDYRDLAAALTRLLDDPSGRHAAGSAGRRVAEEQFSPGPVGLNLRVNLARAAAYPTEPVEEVRPQLATEDRV